MNLKATLFGIFSLTISLLGIWIVILFNVDPAQTDSLTYIAFLASLFLWLAGLITLVEYYLRVLIGKREVIFAHLPQSARHGLLVSLLVTVLLTLQLIRVLNIIEAVMIIILFAISELYFRARFNHA